MKRVVLESPFAAATPEEMALNRQYLLACIRDSLARGEAPYASHLFYTQVLDDSVPDERRLGMEAGFAWGAAAEETIMCVDLAISPGMLEGADRAKLAGRPVTVRSIPGWERAPVVQKNATPTATGVAFDQMRSRANLREAAPPRFSEASQDVEIVPPLTPLDAARLAARPAVPDDEIAELIKQTVTTLPEPPQF